jgi:hypothetical protein
MKARWISERPSPQLPLVGQAIVASFWLWKYYFVSTYQEDTSIPEYKLLENLRKLNNEPPNTTKYVTLISRCNRQMIIKDGSIPIFEREYVTLEDAQKGHTEILRLLKKGLLKFNLLKNYNNK